MSNEKNMYRTGPSAGKGDQPRNLSKQFKNNFDEIDWTPTADGTVVAWDNLKKKSNGKSVYRYGNF
jgi:hypothetical protein